MKLIVNGEEKSEEGVRTVSDLLHRLGIGKETRGVAVALNDEVVPRSKWENTPLGDNDRIEIIHAVQGG